jgi:hypothetical protein
MGSLGRQRFVAVANWRGGKVAREAKALAPSACIFATRGRDSTIHCADIIAKAIRVPDPFVRVYDRCIVRQDRLGIVASDCRGAALPWAWCPRPMQGCPAR